MKRFILQFCLSALLCLIAAPVVYAQATRTWVSGVGDDVNPCSRTAPCKTFAGAISKTATGGEIDVLDPGGFGAVTITKPITIDGSTGAIGSILASGVNGININATTGQVILRNLSINGAGATLGINGINILSGANVQIEHCAIMFFSNAGINVAAGANASVSVRDTTIVNAATGVELANTAGTAFLTMFNSSVSFSSAAGLQVTNGGIANVSNSTFSNNPGTALLPTLGVIRVSNTDVFNNGAGSGTGSGTIVSAGNNRKAGNGTGSADATITTF